VRRPVILLAATSLTLAGAVGLAVNAAPQPSAGASTGHHEPGTAGRHGLAGIPAGAPRAAYRAEPRLPRPAGWPFGEAFPRTSGTGRERAGATFWSDFLYDDHGAAGAMVSQPVASLAPTGGTYIYADPKAKNNGADIFRAAVGLTKRASYWRVDWNTLADKTVPIAEWTMDTDDDTSTGGTQWPANAGVRSPGFERALVVTARGARLLDANGRLIATLPTTVDMRARSFVVRVPRSVLPVAGTWRTRLAAGVADATDRAFAPVSTADGALPGQPSVYNVAFRGRLQEPPVYKPTGDRGELIGNGLARGSVYGNFWMERHQSDALANGDVSAFALDVKWADLQRHRTTREPLPRGYSNRWYVSPLHLGQGVVYNSGHSTGDLQPNFLGRVQPYAVYVPTSYRPGDKTPLTWILHSLSVQHNQYGALDPSMIQQECEDRHSICATTLGYGPDGWYHDEAEVDFWSVWHQLALAYSLDPERTVISGYSMGGYASYKLGLEYPDLFAKAMPLAGPPECGLVLAEGVGGAAGAGRCTKAGDTTPLVGNAKWVPYILGDGVADELVPVSSVLQQVKAFVDAGDRIHFELYPAEDHLVFATQDGFSNEIAQLGTTTRVRNPGSIQYSWYPALQDPKLGIGPTGAYWVRGISARDRSTLASFHATSSTIPNPRITPHLTYGAQVPGDPTPAVVEEQTWDVQRDRSIDSAKTATLTLRLSNVATLTVACGRIGFHGQTIRVTTDGPSRLTLRGLISGTRLLWSGGSARVTEQGRATIAVPKGVTRIRVDAPHLVY
jgi:hypothetical protein